jgi:hypothetical protein
VTARGARRWARLGGVVAVVGCVFLVVLDGGSSAGAADHAGRADAVPTLGAVVIHTVPPGYTVVSQGPLEVTRFASDAPDPTAAARALSTLGGSVSTYGRIWQADGGLNEIQDLLVRFPDPARAQVFLQAAQHSWETGELVSSDPLPSIPGARRVTYFPATNRHGVGQAISMRAGIYVDLLSVFSGAATDAHPTSPAETDRIAAAQYAAVARAAPTENKKGASARTIGLAVVAVAIIAAAVAAPGLLRRRRLAQEAAATSSPLHPPGQSASAGDAVDDLREHRR